MLRPHWHRCDPSTIDYSQVVEGRLRCECGREWTLGLRGWVPNPLTKRRP